MNMSKCSIRRQGLHCRQCSFMIIRHVQLAVVALAAYGWSHECWSHLATCHTWNQHAPADWVQKLEHASTQHVLKLMSPSNHDVTYFAGWDILESMKSSLSTLRSLVMYRIRHDSYTQLYLPLQCCRTRRPLANQEIITGRSAQVWTCYGCCHSGGFGHAVVHIQSEAAFTAPKY